MTKTKDSYNPQKMEWGTDSATKFAKKTTPGQKDVKEGVDLEKEYGKVFYLSAKQVAAQKSVVNKLKAKWDAVEKSLGYDKSKNKDSMGMTPENIRSNPKWRAAKSAWNVAFDKEKKMNQKMVKVFGKELRDLRQKDREAYRSLYMEEGTKLKKFSDIRSRTYR
jgi:hypothetical protein